MLKLILLSTGVSSLQVLNAISCKSNAISPSTPNGPLVQVTLLPSTESYDVCLFDYNGVERFDRQIQNVALALTTKTTFSYNIRRSIPFLKCKGPKIAGPLSFSISGTFQVNQLQSNCLVPYVRGRMLKASIPWSAASDFVSPPGSPLDVTVSRSEWLKIKDSRATFKRFFNLGKDAVTKKPIFNVEKSTLLYEAKVVNSRGQDITRVIFSYNKNGQKVLRGVLSHTPGLDNGFFKLARVPTTEFLVQVAQAGDAVVAQEVAVGVGQAIAQGANAVEVGAAVANAQAVVYEGGFSEIALDLIPELLEILAFIML